MSARTKKRIQRIICAAAAALFVAAADFAVLADELIPVFETHMTGDSAEVYIKSPGSAVSSAEARIGTDKAGNVSVEQDLSRIPVETYLMLDNSISIPQGTRGRISELMTNIAAAKLPAENITLCTFSDSLSVVTERSANYAELKAAVDALQYNDQETYLTDVVNEVMDRVEGRENHTFIRMVVISDGVDNNPGGITRSELEHRLEGYNIPIYTVGIKRNGNEQNLKEMYALSRVSGAQYWTLDDVPDTLQIVSSLMEAEAPAKVTVSIPEQLRDGSRKGLQLILDGTPAESIQVTLPFGEITQTVPETRSYETQPRETARETEEEEEEEEPTFTEWIFDHILLLLVGVLVLFGGIILLILLVVSGKKKEEFEPYDYSFGPSMGVQDRGSPASFGNGETEVLVGSGKQMVLCLEDISQPGRHFEVPLLNSLIIGKNPQLCQVVIDYDKTVSKRHCEIFTDGTMFRVRDLGSTNGTFLDGMRVTDGTAVSSGSILQLGRVELRVQFR